MKYIEVIAETYMGQVTHLIRLDRVDSVSFVKGTNPPYMIINYKDAKGKHIEGDNAEAIYQQIKAALIEDAETATPSESGFGMWTYGNGTLRFDDYYEAINHLRDHGSPQEKSRGVRAWGLP
jgi:hypothetical protein